MQKLDLTKKNNKELRDMLIDLKKELFNLRFQKTHGQIVNTNRIYVIKKNVARVLTMISNNNLKLRNNHA